MLGLLLATFHEFAWSFFLSFAGTVLKLQLLSYKNCSIPKDSLVIFRSEGRRYSQGKVLLVKPDDSLKYHLKSSIINHPKSIGRHLQRS